MNDAILQICGLEDFFVMDYALNVSSKEAFIDVKICLSSEQILNIGKITENIDKNEP